MGCNNNHSCKVISELPSVSRAIGFRLEALLKERNIPQKELAEMFGVSQTAVSAWALGKTRMPVDKLVAIAEFFSVSLDQLCGLEDMPVSEFVTVSASPNRTKRKGEPNHD